MVLQQAGPTILGGAEGDIAPPLFRQAIFFAQNTQIREVKKVPNLYESQANHMFLRRYTRAPPSILHFCCKICVMAYLIHGLICHIRGQFLRGLLKKSGFQLIQGSESKFFSSIVFNVCFMRINEV